MINKEAFKEILLQEIEDIREQLIIEVDKQMMGLYDTLTEYLNEEHDEETNQEANELSVLIADQLHAEDDESEDTVQEDDDKVLELSNLIKEQAKTETPSPSRMVRAVDDIIADLVSNVDQKVNEKTEVDINRLVSEAVASSTDEQDQTEALSERIKETILADSIKKQLS